MAILEFLYETVTGAFPDLDARVSQASFTEEETRTILSDNGDPSGPVWDGIKAKLNGAGLGRL